MKHVFSILALLLSLAVASCGSGEEFNINGTVKGLGNQSLQLVYYAGGAVVTKNSTTNNGAFSFKGSSSNPVIAEIYAGGEGLIGRVVVQNGDKLDCEFDKSNIYNPNISGTIANEEWSKFLRDNSSVLASGNTTQINQLIEKYIVGHKDNILSTLLLVTEYDACGNERRADSLLSVIDDNVCPQSIVESFSAMLTRVNSSVARGNLISMTLYTSGDTTIVYNPTRSTMSLLCITTERGDSIASTLRELNERYEDRRLKIVDLSLENDTTDWKRAIESDSATWLQAWAPGAVMARPVERLGIPRTPYFIVVDSTSTQIYRGTSLSLATDIIKSHLK